jgi:hypothetical protein
MNMPHISVPGDTLHVSNGWLNDVALLKKWAILVALLTFHVSKGWLKGTAP